MINEYYASLKRSEEGISTREKLVQLGFDVCLWARLVSEALSLQGVLHVNQMEA